MEECGDRLSINALGQGKDQKEMDHGLSVLLSAKYKFITQGLPETGVNWSPLAQFANNIYYAWSAGDVHRYGGLHGLPKVLL